MAPQKSGKGSPPRQEPTNIQPYPDWGAMQAYYGPGVPMTPPYMSSPMLPGHPPPQMWGPAQGVMPPYGVPYQAVYPPGVVYAHPHPAVPLVATPGSTQQQPKISETKDRGSTKKVKRLETISTPVSMSTDVAEVEDEDSSWSQDQAFDAPCDFDNPKAKDDRQLKREKRKQANRESARKSRMRKQAEVEELMERYETLKTENSSLNFDINHLMKECEKLRVENAALMEKLGDDEVAKDGETGHGKNSLSIANSAPYSVDDSENELLEDSDETNMLSFQSRDDVVAMA